MVILLAILADWIIGDPENFPHPIRLMGKIIEYEEKLVRKVCKKPIELKIAGLVMTLVNVLGTFFFTFYLLRFFAFNQALQMIVMVHICFTNLAAKSMAKEGRAVKDETKKSIHRGRNRLSYIVGRNTERLSLSGIIRATVETISENTADGVIAPLFYSMINIPLGSAYKMVNTMDSMLGYKNTKYQDLGYFPAKIDDLFNFIPARLTSALMLISAPFALDRKEGLRITLRDHGKHDSPNAGWPESTIAGLLNIRIGGGSFYENIYRYNR